MQSTLLMKQKIVHKRDLAFWTLLEDKGSLRGEGDARHMTGLMSNAHYTSLGEGLPPGSIDNTCQIA